MINFAGHLQSLSLPARFATVGAICAGVAGAIVGLVIGLNVNAPTAWFAVFEAGVPATIVGAAAGGVVGAVTLVVRVPSSSRPRRPG
jgi:hypothetical protein